MTDVDLVIGGGGPVGLVTAIAARRLGLSVLVIERDHGLPAKACGEGLMPGAVAALTHLGVSLSGAIEVRGIRFLDGEHVACSNFARETGRGLSRRELMRQLQARAVEVGAQLWSGHTLRDFGYESGVLHVEAASRLGGRVTCRGRLLVAADGLRSPIRRQLGLELPARQPRRFGLARHFRCAPWSDSVEVYWHDAAEAYVTPVGADEVGVAVLTHGPAASHEAIVALFPALEARLAAATERGRVRGAGPFEQRVQSVLAPGVALVGDAAGYLDALTGEGLSLGFGSAVALVERFAAGELWRYPDDYRRLSRVYYGSTRLMLELARRPRLRRFAMRHLSRRPALFSDLLGIVAGTGTPAVTHAGAMLRWVATQAR